MSIVPFSPSPPRDVRNGAGAPLALASIALILLAFHSAASPAAITGDLPPDDSALLGYDVPIHIVARIHKVVSLRLTFDGIETVRRPDRVELDIRTVPERYRRIFGDAGVPLTWPGQYDLSVAVLDPSAPPQRYRLRGIPRHLNNIASARFTIDANRADPISAEWLCRDGTTITMTIRQTAVSGYQLPAHAEGLIVGAGFSVGLSIDYGTYRLQTLLNSETLTEVYP